MIKLLAQAITLPGLDNSPAPIQYPPALRSFIFQGSKATIGEVVGRATIFIFAFAGMALLLMLLASGFGFLTSAGDAKKLEQSKQRLTFALIGFFIIFASYFLVQFIGKALGLAVFETIFQ